MNCESLSFFFLFFCVYNGLDWAGLDWIGLDWTGLKIGHNLANWRELYSSLHI